MSNPTNMSLDGIVKWAEQASTTPGQDPPVNDINADRVDGKHYSDLKTEWTTDIANNSGASGDAGGDLTGTYPNPTIAQKGASDGQVLTWNGSAWVPTTTASGTSGTAGGDLSGTYPNPTVDAIQGRPLSATAPSTGQALTWNGSAWAPGTIMPGTTLIGAIALDGPVIGVTTTYGWVPAGFWGVSYSGTGYWNSVNEPIPGPSFLLPASFQTLLQGIGRAGSPFSVLAKSLGAGPADTRYSFRYSTYVPEIGLHVIPFYGQATVGGTYIASTTLAQELYLMP